MAEKTEVVAVTTEKGTKVFGPMSDDDANVVEIVAILTGNTTTRLPAR